MSNRRMILTAYPSEPGRLRTIFTPVEGSIRKLIEAPPYLRYAGWNLPTQGQAEIVRGELLRVGGPEYRLLEVYRDGTTIFAMRADEDFLAWATPRDEQRINPTALVEVVYNFANFYGFVLNDLDQKPDSLFMRVDFKNMHLSGVVSYLLPYGSTSWQFGRNREVRGAPEDNVTKIVKLEAGSFRPGIASLEVLKEIYLWFGFDEDKIPYTKVENGQREIDPKQIIDLKG